MKKCKNVTQHEEGGNSVAEARKTMSIILTFVLTPPTELGLQVFDIGGEHLFLKRKNEYTNK